MTCLPRTHLSLFFMIIYWPTTYKHIHNTCIVSWLHGALDGGFPACNWGQNRVSSMLYQKSSYIGLPYTIILYILYLLQYNLLFHNKNAIQWLFKLIRFASLVTTRTNKSRYWQEEETRFYDWAIPDTDHVYLFIT